MFAGSADQAKPGVPGFAGSTTTNRKVIMNAKKAKAIRQFVRAIGRVKAELPAPRSDVIGWTDPVSGRMVRYDLPLTARYPGSSFQRTYRLAKRTLADVRVAIIRARAGAAMVASE